ncbi:(2Fe-2S)-binding protein [Streptomyces cavernae]|uniref:(2Fe-2S)-binding protein n=1 Tax=Streptomyces cavernae TaxID=2259034 RepID=UPI000FEC0B8F|nr:(2Fe-2S)-binding protein [Streptomyces cavernae]
MPTTSAGTLPIPRPRSSGPARTATSPLTGGYARLTELYPRFAVTELTAGRPAPSGGDWVTAEGLAAAGPDLDAFLAWDEEQVRRDYGHPGRPDVIATFGLHRYAWPACLLFTVPWFLDRRVPRFPVRQVAHRRTEGRWAVRVGAFACLPDDPAATLPGARVVPDAEALRAEVRIAVAEHLEPVLRGFGPRMRRRGRALWGMVTDEIVESLWYAAGLLGEEERAKHELSLLLPGTTSPYVGSAGFRELKGPCGELLPTRDRASCCLSYTLRPGDPDEMCDTCPRALDTDRVARLLASGAAR